MKDITVLLFELIIRNPIVRNIPEREITLRKHSKEPAREPPTARSAKKRKSNMTCTDRKIEHILEKNFENSACPTMSIENLTKFSTNVNPTI